MVSPRTPGQSWNLSVVGEGESRLCERGMEHLCVNICRPCPYGTQRQEWLYLCHKTWYSGHCFDIPESHSSQCPKLSCSHEMHSHPAGDPSPICSHFLDSVYNLPPAYPAPLEEPGDRTSFCPLLPCSPVSCHFRNSPSGSHGEELPS